MRSRSCTSSSGKFLLVALTVQKSKPHSFRHEMYLYRRSQRRTIFPALTFGRPNSSTTARNVCCTPSKLRPRTSAFIQNEKYFSWERIFVILSLVHALAVRSTVTVLQLFFCFQCWSFKIDRALQKSFSSIFQPFWRFGYQQWRGNFKFYLLMKNISSPFDSAANIQKLDDLK